MLGSSLSTILPRTIVLLSAALLPVLPVLAASAASAEDGSQRPMRGDTRDRVIALLGDPQGTIAIASKDDEILCYGDTLIEFTAGRVSRISGVGHRDRAVPRRGREDLASSSAITEGEAVGTVEASSSSTPGEELPAADRACSTVSVVNVIVVGDDRYRGCGGRIAATSSGLGAHGRGHGRHDGIGVASCDAPVTRPALDVPSIPPCNVPVSASTFALDVVRKAADPRQAVFDLPDPRMAVLTAADPRWHGDARRP